MWRSPIWPPTATSAIGGEQGQRARVIDKGAGKTTLAGRCLRQLVWELWGAKPDSPAERRILAAIERCRVAAAEGACEDRGPDG